MKTYAISQSVLDGPIPVVCYFTKGLDDVVAGEIHDNVPKARLRSQEERFAIVDANAAEVDRLAATCQTIDDMRLLVAGPTPVADERDFAKFCDEASRRTTELLGQDRQSITPWSVTLSARNPIWRRNPKWNPNEVIKRRLHGADADATARSLVDLRLQIDGTDAHAALSLTERPIGKSADGAAERLGALRPTVAAALVRLATAGVDQAVLRHGVYDPFCGTGTIVAEASRLGLAIFASDIDEGAVTITRTRLVDLVKSRATPADDPAAELAHRVFRHDVLRGVPARVTARMVVANLPWGKQVRVDRRGELFDATAAIVARALTDGGTCALLTTHEDQLAARLRKQAGQVKITSRRIGLLGQAPGIVVARRA